MPKADPVYEEEVPYDPYQELVADKKATLEMVVADCKWVVDLTALLALYAAVSTVLVLLFHRFMATPDVKTACGVVATALIAVLLFFPATKAVQLACEAILLRIRQFTFVPFDFEHRNVVFHALWRALLNTVEITAIWGTGLLCAELIKTANLP